MFLVPFNFALEFGVRERNGKRVPSTFLAMLFDHYYFLTTCSIYICWQWWRAYRAMASSIIDQLPCAHLISTILSRTEQRLIWDGWSIMNNVKVKNSGIYIVVLFFNKFYSARTTCNIPLFFYGKCLRWLIMNHVEGVLPYHTNWH